MDRSAKVAFSLSVNDADPVDAFIQAGIDILGYEAPQFIRSEGMEIQRAVNRQFRQFFLIMIQWRIS